MHRITRFVAVAALAGALSLGLAATASAGLKDGQRQAITVEKSPQFLPGIMQPVVPSGDSFLGSFPKYTGQWIDFGRVFFWLNFGKFFF